MITVKVLQLSQKICDIKKYKFIKTTIKHLENSKHPQSIKYFLLQPLNEIFFENSDHFLHNKYFNYKHVLWGKILELSKSTTYSKVTHKSKRTERLEYFCISLYINFTLTLNVICATCACNLITLQSMSVHVAYFLVFQCSNLDNSERVNVLTIRSCLRGE